MREELAGRFCFSSLFRTRKATLSFAQSALGGGLLICRSSADLTDTIQPPGLENLSAIRNRLAASLTFPVASEFVIERRGLSNHTQ
jgi:hypothetical protein